MIQADITRPFPIPHLDC